MPLTAQDLFLAARDRLLATSDLYSPEAIDRDGNDVNLFLKLVAGIGEELSLESSQRDNARYLATVASVSDDDVDRLVSDLTGGAIQRFRENAAVVDLRFSRTNHYALAIPAGAIASTLDGVPFRTLDEIAWSNNDNSPKTVAAICETTGIKGNVSYFKISKASGDFGDKTISVSNETPASGGRAAETSIELIGRARSWFINASRGTLSAIEFGGLQTPGIVQASATELSMSNPFAADNDILLFTVDENGIVVASSYSTEPTTLPFYRVSMVVADESGQAGSALARRVQETLQEYRCAGVPVSLSGGTLQYERVRWTGLTIKKGYAQATVLAELASKIVAASKNILPSHPLERALLIAIAKFQVDGISAVPDNALVEPASDQAAAPGYTIRIRPEDVTFV